MNAIEIIRDICGDLSLDAEKLTAEDKQRVRDALEDGSALEAMGLTDEDQEAVEEAHAMMV